MMRCAALLGHIECIIELVQGSAMALFGCTLQQFGLCSQSITCKCLVSLVVLASVLLSITTTLSQHHQCDPMEWSSVSCAVAVACPVGGRLLPSLLIIVVQQLHQTTKVLYNYDQPVVELTHCLWMHCALQLLYAE
eukprot:GHUV01032739.1.p1 GENE.GHUV01032739.1~~GHUV01032739.1.p1  ORF type:complete len:136 (+),score=10.82 GHUV01032739.1:74-481(+)